MSIVLVIVAILVCILLGLIVLIQNPKGGGLNSNFSSSSQLMGVQKTGDFLEKGTWILAITLMVLALAINVTVKTGGTSGNSELQETIREGSKPVPTATAPAALPGAQKADTSKK
ncbi:MAG: preprotein translocase subunit SecG [Sphingobacteriaceae bacterium]|nr:MAG: preprotein translocase subunit SecG [Sphingobacteriaceae bacterium]